ncbi:hypothetical protein F01_260153 [Burkholderia cenocepacia]|nr:hypothetical protein F01_260153 [Burkholderia cenocepacia]
MPTRPRRLHRVRARPPGGVEAIRPNDLS